jgi:hypothetical protein
MRGLGHAQAPTLRNITRFDIPLWIAFLNLGASDKIS